uniref:Large ribosomal subunit protein bL32m n=1 Tax=Schistocephalus solidus TaxID=70667 RepID=A0A0X3QGE8_SCHSO
MLFFRHPPLDFCVVHAEKALTSAPRDIFDRFILFAVPKKRHSIERRRYRKFLSFTMDKIKLRQDLVACQHCGTWHPRSSLCVQCYDEVRRETNALRDSLQVSNLAGLSHTQPTEFLYDHELPKRPNALHHYVDRKRPQWFSTELFGGKHEKDDS